MERYGNADSGVSAFEIGSDYIRLSFRSGEVYRYDYGCPGPAAVERMKSLALSGRGLSTYVSQFVRDRYSARE